MALNSHWKYAIRHKHSIRRNSLRTSYSCRDNQMKKTPRVYFPTRMLYLTVFRTQSSQILLLTVIKGPSRNLNLQGYKHVWDTSVSLQPNGRAAATKQFKRIFKHVFQGEQKGASELFLYARFFILLNRGKTQLRTC